MEWYYAVGDKQMGPVAEDEFKRLAAEGTILPDTLVWNSTMDSWKPYGEVSVPGESNIEPTGEEAMPALAEGDSVGGSTVVCSECGKLFKQDEVVKIDNNIICGECKPAFLQRMREGAFNSSQPVGEMTQEEILASDYEVNVSDSLSASWELFQRNIGIVIGASLLVFVAMAAANMVPYLSLITGMLLSGPLWAGLWYFFILLNRGRDVTVGDAFSGFNRGFWQLVLVNIVTSIATFVCMLPVFIVMAAIFGTAFVISQGTNGPPPGEFGVAGVVLFGGSFIVSLSGVVFLTTIWIYALPLVIDKGLGFWEAMELSRKMVFKHFWGTLLLIIVWGILGVVGMMMCGVGLLITGPIAFGAWVWHYERIFGNLRPES